MKSYPIPEVDSSPCLCSKFKKWVQAFGPSKLANSLRKNRTAVYAWISDGRNRRWPRRIEAYKIVALSRKFPMKVGPLAMHDVLGDGELKGLNLVSSELGKPDRRFYEWLAMMGADALAQYLATSKSAVGALMNGARPSMDRARLIAKLSRKYPMNGRPLTISEIRGQENSVQKAVKI